MNQLAVIGNVKRRLDLLGASAGWLISRANIGRDTWAKYESGRRQPTCYALYRMAIVLGCSMEELMEGVEDEES